MLIPAGERDGEWRRSKNLMEDRRTVLVTGGAGFIGSHLCEALLRRGDEVICLDSFNRYYDPTIKRRNLADVLSHERFHLITGDIREALLVERILGGGLAGSCACRIPAPTVVVHLAAMAGVRPSLADPGEYVDVDVRGTVNLLEAARACPGVNRFVFGSSSSVYGARDQVPFCETDPTECQVSPYATAKKAGELYCRTYHELYGLPVSVLRFFTVYGPRQRPDMAVHRFVNLLKARKPIPLYGDGTSGRDYTYIEDCVQGILCAMDSTTLPFEIYNLGSARLVQLRELVRLIADCMSTKPTIEWLPPQRGDVPITLADITRAREVLGYQPRTDIETGIESFVRWYESQADRRITPGRRTEIGRTYL